MVERRTLADDLRESGYDGIIYLNRMYDSNDSLSHQSFMIVGFSQYGVVGETYSADGEIKQSGVGLGELEKLLHSVRAPPQIVEQISSHLESKKST